MHYVYIIYSAKNGIFYKGESVDPYLRLEAHNCDLSEFTSGKGPWVLVYIEEFIDRKSALTREKAIKRLNRRSLDKLISGDFNLLKK
jgi:putative endonuclease